jgi:hypothetical protein
VALALVGLIWLVGAIAGPDHGQAPSPTGQLGGGPEVQAYLSRVEVICQRHDREISGSGKVPVDAIVRSETEVTHEIASTPVPAAARGVRNKLLAARRLVDAIAFRTYRVMERSRHPLTVYNRELAPIIQARSRHMYEVFGSFGIHCNVA